MRGMKVSKREGDERNMAGIVGGGMCVMHVVFHMAPGVVSVKTRGG
jgi:hypothetical protein